MNIDAIIESLNGNKAFPPSTIQGGDGRLSPEEKEFMEKYDPGSALIIYGTLAPGQPNHSVVEHIRGKGRQGIVRGILEKKGWGADLGYYGFRPAMT